MVIKLPYIWSWLNRRRLEKYIDEIKNFLDEKFTEYQKCWEEYEHMIYSDIPSEYKFKYLEYAYLRYKQLSEICNELENKMVLKNMLWQLNQMKYHTWPPRIMATLSDLEKSLKEYREILDKSKDKLQAYSDYLGCGNFLRSTIPWWEGDPTFLMILANDKKQGKLKRM